MVEQIKAKLKLLEKLTDAIRQGLTVEDIRNIFSNETQVGTMTQNEDFPEDHKE